MHSDSGIARVARGMAGRCRGVRWRWLPVALVVLVAGCGGGGGSRSDPPPPPPPPPPPNPPPLLVQPPNPAYSRHLEWTGADAAHAAGFTGAGIRIGVIDSGVNRNHPALRGRVVANLNYVNPANNNLAVDDMVGHGTAVAQTIAGTAFGQWPGGIAPGAEILSARIINDNPPSDDGSGRGNEVSGALGLRPIHNDLSARGMRIMNNSWGGLYWTNPAATNPIADEYRDFVHNRGGIVVFSAGNEGFANPSDTAALPDQPGPGGSRPAADLERGWLTVVALDGNNRGQLADYSNACGIAIRYCLAAPGTVIVTGTNDAPNAPEYWRWTGTSFAAPIISGAAALVWEAFPYFDNDLVRQTLLGTATDLGEPGPDVVFGYGAVNIERAVKGPALLDWGDVTVDFDAMTSTWGNQLTGAGRVIKRGSGTLVLGDSVRNGGLDIEGGTLHAMREVRGDIAVGTQGRFVFGDGDQAWWMYGTLDNAGHVELVGGTGNVTTLEGDYHHRDTATLGLELGQIFRTTGSIRIDGGTLHLLGIKSGYTASARADMLHGSEGISGEFANLTWADSLFLEGSLAYGPTDVWLDITRLNVAATAQAFGRITPAALSAAVRVERAFAGLDGGTGGDGAADAEFLRAAGAFQRLGTEAAALDALERLSGQAHARAATLTFDGIDQHRRTLAARLAGLDGNAIVGAWRETLDSGLTSAGWNGRGWLMGRDARIGGGQLVAGFAFGETLADGWSGGVRERAQARQTQLHGYLGRVTPGAYLAAQLGAGRIERGIERHPFAGDAMQGVYSRSAGRYGSLGLETGTRLSLGAARLSPYLGVALDWLDQDGFHEAGAAGFGLTAAPARMRRTQATLGLRTQAAWRGLDVSGYAQWQQVLAADGFDVPARFTGMDGFSPLPRADAARPGGLYGIGMHAWLSRNTRVAVNFDQRFGARGSERSASVRYVWGF